MQLAELECNGCGNIVAHVQVIPKTIFVHGEVYCADCYEVEDEEE